MAKTKQHKCTCQAAPKRKTKKASGWTKATMALIVVVIGCGCYANAVESVPAATTSEVAR